MNRIASTPNSARITAVRGNTEDPHFHHISDSLAEVLRFLLQVEADERSGKSEG